MKEHDIEDSWLKFWIVFPFLVLVFFWIVLFTLNAIFGFKEKREELELQCKDKSGDYIYIKSIGMTCIKCIIQLEEKK